MPPVEVARTVRPSNGKGCPSEIVASGQVTVMIKNQEIIAGIHCKTAVVSIGYLHGVPFGSAEIDQLFFGLFRRFYALGNQYGPFPLINGMVFTFHLRGNANPTLI